MKKAIKIGNSKVLPRIIERFRKCHLLALDFDGVLTDNCVFVDSDGREMVRCDKYDSTGMATLRELGFPVIILTREPEKIRLVPLRAKKLGIKCYCGLEPGKKLPKLKEIARELGIGLENICYVGNDTNDLDCLENVGLAIAVADSHPDILHAVDFISSKPGGRGAVREICDLLLKIQRGGNQ